MPAEPSSFASLAVTSMAYKAGLVAPAQATSPHAISSIPPHPSLWLKREKQRNRSKRKQDGVVLAYRDIVSLSLGSIAQLGWPTLVVTREHLENLVRQGYMTMAKLATCHVPTDLASPPTAYCSKSGTSSSCRFSKSSVPKYSDWKQAMQTK
jgi:hypothetical protein